MAGPKVSFLEVLLYVGDSITQVSLFFFVFFALRMRRNGFRSTYEITSLYVIKLSRLKFGMVVDAFLFCSYKQETLTMRRFLYLPYHLSILLSSWHGIKLSLRSKGQVETLR